LFGGEIHFLRENSIERLFLRVFGSWHTGARIRAFYMLRLAAKHLKPGCRILDAGCGLGRHAFFIGKKYPNSSIIGVDSNGDNISICNAIREKNGFERVRFLEGDLRFLDSGEHFDLIICSDVLEYIEEDDVVLINFRRLLKEKGRLLLHTPRVNSTKYLRFFEKYFKRDPLEESAHAREGYTEPQLRHKLRENGFMITDLQYTFGYFGSLSWELSKVLERVKPLFILCFPLILLLGYMDSLKANRKGNGILIEAQPAREWLV
jgi:ubiquinone/menaquinone biosynthesis C-methylase UbiE